MWVTIKILVFIIYCIIFCASLNLLTHSHVCQICPRMSNIVLQMHSCVHIHERIIACELLVCTSTLVCRKYVFVCMYEHWYGHCCYCCYREHRSSAEGSEAELEETVVETFSTWGKLRCLSGLDQTAWPDNGDMQHYSYQPNPVRWHRHITAATTASALAKGLSLSWTPAVVWSKTYMKTKSSRFGSYMFYVINFLCVKAVFVSCMDNVAIKELIK